MGDRFICLTQLAISIRKDGQRICQLAAQVFGFGERPFVEVQRVLEAESGQEVVAVDFDGIR